MYSCLQNTQRTYRRHPYQEWRHKSCFSHHIVQMCTSPTLRLYGIFLPHLNVFHIFLRQWPAKVGSVIQTCGLACGLHGVDVWLAANFAYFKMMEKDSPANFEQQQTFFTLAACKCVRYHSIPSNSIPLQELARNLNFKNAVETLVMRSAGSNFTARASWLQDCSATTFEPSLHTRNPIKWMNLIQSHWTMHRVLWVHQCFDWAELL